MTEETYSWTSGKTDRVKDILGTEFLDNSIELHEREKKIVLMGLLGFPTFNHSNSNNQFVFVNGRIINDKSMNTIFRVAYRDFLFHFDLWRQLFFHICHVQLYFLYNIL